MRASRWVIFGAASHVCCAQASSSSSDVIIGPNSAPCASRDVHSHSPRSPKEKERREVQWSWFVTGGGTNSAAVEDERHSRWWRSRKRWAKRQAEMAAEEATQGHRSLAEQIARKQVIVVQGLLRRLKRWLGAIVDITTLKRVRLLRKARQVRRVSVG